MSCLYPVIAPKKEGQRIVGYQVFPCGRCPDCIRRKQNDYVQRFYLASKSLSPLWFFTGTFRDNAVPLLCKPLEPDELINHPSDEIEALLRKEKALHGLHFEKGVFVQDSVLRDWYVKSLKFKNFNGKRVSICEPRFIDYVYNGIVYPSSLCASLDNRLVQLFIKRFRQYFSSRGVKLNFKYIIAGELGPVGHRPHYHMLLLGLSRTQAFQFKKMWSVDFGISDLQLVDQVANGGQDHYEFVSRYVAKYLVKGSFQDCNIKAGYSRVPRVMSSSNLLQLDDRFRSWYSGSDIFPDQFRPISEYSVEDLDRLISRLHLNINGKSYGLSSSIKKKLFYYEESRKSLEISEDSKKSGKGVEISLRATPLQKAMSQRLQSRAIDCSLRQFGQLTGTTLEEADYRIIDDYKSFQVFDKLLSAKDILEKQKSVYKSSKF